ncbi:hypothetical protein E2562_025479 [Oryza meyeriana var. granulata]|uniref:Uncharacterized protein n=1 Tax=Oryza meyeriana var. granulata TaxID=110450 RepID=A0A6G1CJW5_9ORYZ|nr:hypothetical protein E2562_025479 [Oryza meyeriana var. granulata]
MEYTPPPLECKEIEEEAESSALARQGGRGQGHGSRGGWDGGGTRGGRDRGQGGWAAALGEVEAMAARVAAKAMAMNRRRSGHGWSRY